MPAPPAMKKTGNVYASFMRERVAALFRRFKEFPVRGIPPAIVLAAVASFIIGQSLRRADST